MSNTLTASRCLDRILECADPFDRFTKAARSHIEEYLGGEIEYEGVLGTRGWHVEHTRGFRDALWTRLGWIGRGLVARMADKISNRESVVSMVAIQLEDLLAEHEDVARASGSSWCG